MENERACGPTFIGAVISILIRSICRRSLVALAQIRAEIGSRVNTADVSRQLGSDVT